MPKPRSSKAGAVPPAFLDAYSATRRAKREARFGPQNVCTLCGESDLVALVHAGRTLLEEHHVASRRLVPDAVLPLCRNCHAKEHERLGRAGVVLMESPSELESVVSVLRAYGVVFDSLARASQRWASELLPTLALLDRAIPQWRETLKAEGPTP